MKMPSFKDVRLPLGSIPSNWPLLLGFSLSAVVLVGLLMTGEDVVEEVDPLNPAPRELGEVEAVDPRLLVGGDIDAQAARLRAEQLEAERRRLQEAERIRREAGEEARARAVQLARAEEQLARLRARQAETPEPREQETPMDLLARTADEADLLETLRLEDIARRAEAVRAPMVVSSARGIGERQHALRSAGAFPVPGTAGPGNLQPGLAPQAAPAVPGVLAADPAIAGPQAFPQPPVGVLPAPAPEPGFYDDPPAGGFYGDPPLPGPLPAGGASGGRVRVPGGDGRAGTLTAGPSADGRTGGLGPTGVVVTPHDGRDYRLYEGTMLPAVLQTQLDGTFSGPLSAQVTRHVYSADRQRVLVPRGTVALGTSEGVQDLWQGRLAVGFHRLIFPDGRWVRMEFGGMNGLGETSLRDQVNRHYLQMFAAAGGVGLLAGFAQAGGGGQGQFRSAVSEQMANTSLQIVERFLNRLPEVTIRAGHRVNIRLMADLVVPAEAAWDVD